MTNRSTIFYCFFLLFITSLTAQRNHGTKLEVYLQGKELTNVHNLDSTIRVDLKYASTDNFTKTILYDSLFNNIYLHPVAAVKLVKAQKYLKTFYPDYSLLVYDAVRPLNIQRKMYKVVQGTPYAIYVAEPTRTGLHNYGMAVDLTICDKEGKALDMGTPFDFFGRAAGINREAELIQEGVLTKKQVQNRELLRKVMTYAGFLTIRGEWWHFNAVSLSEAKRLYNVIE
ncbi:MAG: M15 family metallopeptidase [Dysgonomonas sp.]|nr:M15 family metallopeptidase [Dysgonomonas sp.]